MNYLSIDYGSKRIGLAYTVNDIIFTLPQILNDDKCINNLLKIIDNHKINKIFVGMSHGIFAQKTSDFITLLKLQIDLPIETVEEAVSTIEAHNFKKTKSIDSVAAAIILNRALGV